MENGTKDNIEDFKRIITDFDNRLKEIEKQQVLDKAEIFTKVEGLKNLRESVYKQSIQNAVDKGTKEMLDSFLSEKKQEIESNGSPDK